MARTNPPVEPLITTEELAEMLHTSVGVIHYWRSMGKGPTAIKVGRKLLFRPSDVEAWFDQYRSEPRTVLPRR